MDYTFFKSADCAGTLVDNDSKTCTITFNDISPQLEVVTNVVGGTNVPSDFTVDITGTHVSQPTLPGDSDGKIVTLFAGSYSVDEADSLGYTKTLSPGCSGTINPGDVVTCTITNTAPSGGDNGEGGDEGNGSADLTITKVADKTAVNVGDTINYTLVVTNNGPDDATTVDANDVLPSVLTFYSSSSTQGSYATSTNLWTIGDLPHGDSATTTIAATVNANPDDNTITNVATVSADQTDIDTDNNTATSTVTVNTGSGDDLEIFDEEVTGVGLHSVTITWQTSHLATSRVIYDTVSHPSVLSASPPNYGYAFSTVEDSTKVIETFGDMNRFGFDTDYYFRPVSHGSPEVEGAEIDAGTQSASNGGGGGFSGSNGGGGGFCLGNCGTGGSSGSGSGGVPEVLGATTHVPASFLSPTPAPTPTGEVLGASTTRLPRTGIPGEEVLSVAMLSLAGAYGALRKRK